MKTLGMVVVMFTTVAIAQEKSRGHNLNFAALVDRPVAMQMGTGSVYVQGNWSALDGRSTLPGPSVSEISCDRAQQTCHESEANITVTGNAFTLSADSVDYKVTKWDSTEIVAQNIGGICRVLNVLKFDLKNQKVYSLQSLSEPAEDLSKTTRDICNAVGLRLELRGSTTYSLDAR